jgi:carboxypeptidase Q
MQRASFALVAVAALGCGATPSPARPSATVPPPAPALTTSAAAASTSAAPAPPPAALPEAVQKLEATPSRAFDVVQSLTDEVGPRMAGSTGDALAVSWALRTLASNGLTSVRPERVMVTHWERGVETAEIVGPVRQPLRVTALGGSTATPAAGIEADVVEVESMKALEALSPAAAAGKIVFVDAETHRTRDGHGYGETVGARFHGAPDSELLHRVIQEKGSARVHLVLGPRTLPDAPSANVLGEVRGREKPDEIVVIGAHLDSWDLGTGAIDDGAGCGVVIDAARRIAMLAQPPRRTVRVVLFANEEHGLEGGKGYAEAHKAEVDHTVAAIEADLGAGRAFGVRYSGSADALARFQVIAAFVEPLGVAADPGPAHGGSDISPLRALGVPVLDLQQDASRYFDWHHSANDTLDKIDPAEIAQAATAVAVVAWGVAEMDGDLGRVPEEKRSSSR